MATDHYFTGEPGTELKLRTVTVHLAGADRELTTANGIFSPGRIDPGTQILLAEAPAPPATGNILDLGCGWGPIAFTIALASPDATVWAVDVNERSLDLVRLNAGKLGLTNVRAVLPDQVPADVVFDEVWSNPPIRIGKQALHEMLEYWLPRLAPGSDAWLVVQKNLGADSLQKWLAAALGGGFRVSRHASDKGFRVLLVERLD